MERNQGKQAMMPTRSVNLIPIGFTSILSLLSIVSNYCSYAWIHQTGPIRRIATYNSPKREGKDFFCSFSQGKQWTGLSAVDPDDTDNQDITSSSLDIDSLYEMDCVVISCNGHVKKELAVMEENKLQPLSAWTMEEAFADYIEFVVDEEDRGSIAENDIIIHSLIPSDCLSFGSRQVGGGKGPGNPHGEESELLYYIRNDALEGIEVTVKPELEITW